MKFILLLLIFIYSTTLCNAQNNDTLLKKTETDAIKNKNDKSSIKKFILPASLFSYGVIFSQIHSLNRPDEEIAVYDRKHIFTHRQLDNYLQYTPAAITLGLDAFKIKGVHNFKEKIVLYGLTTIINATLTESLKYAFHRYRPDSAARNSFPSGHTATAFAAAEFMRMEYGGKSSWYSVAGYGLAGVTGFLRIYNNRHWLSDVVAGAGIGILSTRLAYWSYPALKKLIFHKKDFSFITTPYYDGYSGGLKFVVLQKM